MAELKIITFTLYRDCDEWYARSPDSMFHIGETLEASGESLQELHDKLFIEMNDRFFNDYDIDMFTDGPKVEFLLSKGIPLVNKKEVV